MMIAICSKVDGDESLMRYQEEVEETYGELTEDMRKCSINY